MPKTPFNGESLANKLLGLQAVKNVEVGEAIVADTFSNPNECEYNLLCMGVEVQDDGARIAAHRFRPYNRNERHSGLSEAVLFVSLDKEIKLDDNGIPLYRILGEGRERSRHGYKVLSVRFGEFQGKKFIPKD